MINLNKVTVALPSACGEDATIEVDMAMMPVHILQALMEHGLKQKVADSVANATKLEWTAVQSVAACQSVVDSLMAGTWAKKGGGAKIRTFEQYVTSKATMAAKARMEKDEKAKALGLEKVVAAYSKSESLRATWLVEWNARQAAKSTEIDLGDEV
jgi:hypothetical protein